LSDEGALEFTFHKLVCLGQTVGDETREVRKGFVMAVCVASDERGVDEGDDLVGEPVVGGVGGSCGGEEQSPGGLSVFMGEE
jgi:hypothetical protein